MATATTPELATVAGSALGTRAAPRAASPWGQPRPVPPLPPSSLDQLLAGARTWAALAATDRTRRAIAVHAALGAAHDLLLAARAEPAASIALTGAEQAAPAQIVALVFGARLGWRDRVSFAATLAHAQRLNLGRGDLARMLDRHEGGYRGVVAAEQLARRIARGRAPVPPLAIHEGLTLRPLLPIARLAVRRKARAA